MNRLLLALALVCSLLSGCATLDDIDNTTEGNLRSLWTTLDEHYCYFEQKGVDWPLTYTEYLPRAQKCQTADELFDVCADMLATLRDGHVNLVSTARTSYYREWWTAYPQDFSLRTIQQYYLHFDYRTTGAIIYEKMAGGRIGYIYYSTFNAEPGPGALDAIFSYFADCDGIIIDIRGNGGGLLTSVDAWVGRFIETDVTAGYIRHKTGPGHQEFSEPYPITYAPAQKGRVKWHRPIVVLTNRSCYSAANDFVSVMKQLPQVTVIGARTGGGGGLPFSSEMPCGWSVRFSACPVSDAAGRDIEEGIEPTEGFEVHAPDSELAAGHDAILERAIAYLIAN